MKLRHDIFAESHLLWIGLSAYEFNLCSLCEQEYSLYPYSGLYNFVLHILSHFKLFNQMSFVSLRFALIGCIFG